jgi:putative effector of murein hydrolase
MGHMGQRPVVVLSIIAGGVIGSILGTVACAVIGIRHEVTAGETELLELFQWGVMACPVIGGVPGAMVGGLAGLVIGWRSDRRK